MTINMKYNLPDRILRELSFFAKKYSVTKIILFGSRARGTNTERSDIDIVEILNIFIGMSRKMCLLFLCLMSYKQMKKFLMN